MIVWWGPDLTFFYNDAYLPLLGSKHPALGKPGENVWAEIWDIIGPMLASVMTSGDATWSEDLLLPMDRHGYWEETYWTYSFSPLHDDEGVVRGVFTAVSDTTERVIGERRLAALQDLGSLAGRARSAAEAAQLVGRALAGAADVPFAAVYLRRPDTGEPVLTATSAPGPAPAPLASGPGDWPVADVLRTGQPVTVTDVATRFEGLPSGGGETSPAEAMVLPLPGELGAPPVGRWCWRPGRRGPWMMPTRSFLGLVASRPARWSTGPWPTRSSSGGPKTWPTWTGPRPSSFPISATSSAPRSP
jgi:PAS fold